MRGLSNSDAVSSTYRAAHTRTSFAAMALVWLRLFVMCTPDAPQGTPKCEPERCPKEADGAGGMATMVPSKPPPAQGCTADSDCAKSEYCARGACVADVCEQGRASCDPKEEAVVLCSAAGDRELRLRCNTGQTCDGEPGKARCSDWVCMPGAKSCAPDGTTVTACAMNGLGTETVVDCGRTKQVCAAGACKDAICKPSLKLCDGNAVYRCSADGTSRTLVETCTAQQYCESALAGCTAQVCTPGSVECQKDRPATCRADGSGWDPGDECPTGEACTAGTCQSLACKPGKDFCSSGSVRRCSSDGLSSALVNACDPGSYRCVETASGASCEINYCVPSVPICEGNVATSCKPDGSGPAPGGTDCGADHVCYNAACQPKACEPGVTFCMGSNIEVCDSLGLSYQTVGYCTADQYCNAALSACSQRVCSAGTHGCTGEVYGSCNADGSAFVSETNCASTSKVCGTGGCSVSALDEVGETTQFGEGPSLPFFFGNVVSVKTSRTLTKIEMYLDQPSASFQGTLQWGVYEKSGTDFTRIVSEATPYNMAGLPSSDTLKASLVASHTYVIGVYLVPNASSFLMHEASFAPEGVTFGEVTGSFNVQTDTFPVTLVSAQARPDVIDHQRLTTALPQ